MYSWQRMSEKMEFIANKNRLMKQNNLQFSTLDISSSAQVELTRKGKANTHQATHVSSSG